MGKGGGTDPFPASASDARKLIAMEEAALNRAMDRTAAFNFFDVQTPFGSRMFTGTPGQPDFLQTETFSPFRQRLMGMGEEQLDQFGSVFNQPIGGMDLMDNAAAVERATFDRGLNLLQPTFDLQRERLENQLVTRGIPRSSDAFQTEFQTRIDDPQQRALENLALSAVGAGRAEQTRAINTDLARRAGMLGELGFFGAGGAASPSMFQPTPPMAQQAPGTQNAFGMSNQAIAAQNQMAADQKAGNTQAGAGLATAAIMAAAMMACSRDWKTDGKPTDSILDKVERLPVETWRYKGETERHIGPYAEDFREIFGFGDGRNIPVIDAVGVCLQAIKELQGEIRELKACQTAQP